MPVAAFEKNNRLDSEIVFRDPIHGYIHVHHQLILDLIDTKEFQRLRRVKQLGTALYTFHGAEHSRFTHSLGVYEIALQICDLFVRKYPEDWNDDERLVTLAAALLHDLGHGPFSHTFEQIFKTDHEQITVDIILDENTEVNQVLRRVSANFPNQVASVITKEYPNPQVVQLISSQIDADRMDYLQRDAYYTGVTYGRFDLARILHMMRPYPDGIAFQQQGMHAVEDYIVRRYQMYMQIYFHPVSRGMEVTLERLLTRAKDLYQEGKLEVIIAPIEPFLAQDFDIEDYLRLDDSVLLTCIELWTQHDDAYLRTLASMFIHRQPLKSVSFQPDKDMETVNYLRNLVERLQYNKKYFTQINQSSDISYDYLLKEKAPITLIYPNGDLIDISQASPIVETLSDNLHGNDRLYVPRELLRKKLPSQQNLALFKETYYAFQSRIKNGMVISPEETDQ